MKDIKVEEFTIKLGFKQVTILPPRLFIHEYLLWPSPAIVLWSDGFMPLRRLLRPLLRPARDDDGESWFEPRWLAEVAFWAPFRGIVYWAWRKVRK